MSSGLAPQLPLNVDSVYGAYGLITDYETLVRQNLRMLLLTCPGERVMDMQFGVGLRHMLFETPDGRTLSKIDTKIREQVNRYLPFVRVDNISFLVPENDPDMYPHTINIKMFVTIVPLGSFTMLELDVAGGSS